MGASAGLGMTASGPEVFQLGLLGAYLVAVAIDSEFIPECVGGFECMRWLKGEHHSQLETGVSHEHHVRI